MASLAKIMAMHLGALGDFVLSWPALGMLARDHELHVWGRSDWAKLLLPPAQVHEREAARFANLFSGEPGESMQTWLGGFERVVVFAHRPPADLLAGLESALPGRVWQVPTKPSPGAIKHAGRVQVEALARLGLQPDATAIKPLVDNIPHPRALIAPGSGGRSKRLPLELVQRAWRTWREAGLSPLLLLGPAEDEAFRRELKDALAGLHPEFMYDPSIAQLAAHLAVSPAYLGADSGVSHLAAALGAPCLVGFGPSDPAIWAPVGPRVYIRSFDQLTRLEFTALDWN
jgi:heptosyltransferase-3